jgi:deazaflavin-dependent oxidoreductase (nitroreductase family)
MVADVKMAEFREPNAIARAFNRFFGLLVGLGIGPQYNYLLEVRGRKTGRIYSTPVNLMEAGGKQYLVAPRGRTQWVRNAEATGEITLKRGNVRKRFRLRSIPDNEKPPLLKLYLESYVTAVRRYFPVPVGSTTETFQPIARYYPVFELIAATE